MLEIRDLNVHYGAIHALKGVNLRVEAGEIVTLIGPNGAGKTTLLKTISGLLKPTSGQIVFDGSDISFDPPHKVVCLGLSHVPEGRMIFQNLTVRENLELGAFSRKDKATQADMDAIFSLFPRLQERLKQNAGTLSGGEQQMLAIGRALMAKPKLLLLDEPSLGIAPALVQQIFKVLVEINAAGTTMLLVEQDAYLALRTAKRAYVLETGKIAMEDTSENLKNHPDIKKVYLGG